MKFFEGFLQNLGDIGEEALLRVTNYETFKKDSYASVLDMNIFLQELMSFKREIHQMINSMLLLEELLA